MEKRILTQHMVACLNNHIIVRNLTFKCVLDNQYPMIYFKPPMALRGVKNSVQLEESGKMVVSEFFDREGMKYKFIDDDRALIITDN